jgi:hypothetical protein
MKRSKISWRRVLALRDKGDTGKKIAEKLGCSVGSVFLIAKKYRYLNGDGMKYIRKIEELDISEGEKDIMAEIYKSIVDLKSSGEIEEIDLRKWESDG